MGQMNLFRPSYHTEEILNELRPVLDSGWCGPGPKCAEFEKNFNKFTGAKYSHYVNSATSALHLALILARDMDRKDGRGCNPYVLTTPLTFVSTNSVILYERMHPVFVDINDYDLSLDQNDFLNKKEHYKSDIGMWVHYGGFASPHFDYVANTMEQMSEQFEGFYLIEDCAHAMGGFYSDKKRVGSYSGPNRFQAFSFQAVKNCPTADSGMITVPTPELLKKVKELAWMGIDKDTFARTNSGANEVYKWKYDVPHLGYKNNGNDIMATIANVQLRYLDRDNAYRKQLYTWYKENLHSYTSKICLVEQCEDSSHHLIVVRVKNRDEVILALKSAGIAPGVHYLPNYEFPIFSKYYKKGDCPNCERISKEIISIPNHLLVTKQDVDNVCEVIINAARD